MRSMRCTSESPKSLGPPQIGSPKICNSVGPVACLTGPFSCLNPCYFGPWHGGAVDQGGQVRPELDPAFLPQVRGQPGEIMAVRPDLQPGQLLEKAGVAGGYEALDSDQSSDQADQDGWATGTPRKEAGVSACRGAGNQGNADRDARTDQPASAGTWLACFERGITYLTSQSCYPDLSRRTLPLGINRI